MYIDNETFTPVVMVNHEHNTCGENFRWTKPKYDFIYHFPIDFEIRTKRNAVMEEVMKGKG